MGRSISVGIVSDSVVVGCSVSVGIVPSHTLSDGALPSASSMGIDVSYCGECFNNAVKLIQDKKFTS
jgi:hypothetical protein